MCHLYHAILKMHNMSDSIQVLVYVSLKGSVLVSLSASSSRDYRLQKAIYHEHFQDWLSDSHMY